MKAENNDKLVKIFFETPLDGIDTGKKLSYEQSAFLGKKLDEIIAAIAQRRQFVFVNESLQSTIGQFLRILGWEVQFQLPLDTSGGETGKKVYDIVARKDSQMLVVETSDEVTPAELEQMGGHKKSVQVSRKKAQIYLGTDILNSSKLLDGIRGVTIQDLMERKKVGVILIDKYAMLTCNNFSQLVLEEMPQILISSEKVG